MRYADLHQVAVRVVGVPFNTPKLKVRVDVQSVLCFVFKAADAMLCE